MRIREQSFRVLVYLLEHTGELVSREDLRRVLWPADTFVDFDHSLNTAMMKLRDALGDVADAPIYIETIPKRGYRFIAPISQPAVDVNAQAGPPPPTPAATDNGPAAGIGPAAALLIVSMAVIAFLLVRNPLGSRSAGAPELELLRTVPITTAAGDAISPVLSPDGREIAFVWDGSDRKGYDLYVQLVGADLPLRLTYQMHGLIGQPAWSPAGTEIAFERCDGKHDGVFAVPALSGEERQLATAACYYTLPNPLVWMANGTDMLMVDRCPTNGRFDVVDLSLGTGQKRCLTSIAGDKDDIGWGFALSPDGSTIAFGRTNVSLCCDIYMVPVNGGQIRHLTSDGQSGCSLLSEFGCSGIMWTPDGQAIVYVTTQRPLSALVRVPAKGGPSERETTYPGIGNLTRDGKRFAYSQHISSDPPAIWRADLSTPGGPVREKGKIIASQFPELDGQPSPDGTLI